MTVDPRLTPANDRVAAAKLRGSVDAPEFVEGTTVQCRASAADLLDEPDGARAAQLLFGDLFEVYERRDGYAFGQSRFDDYCGYVREDLLGEPAKPTHWITVPASHLYPEPNVKARTMGAAYFASEVTVDQESGMWARLHSGQFIPKSHLAVIGSRFDDPVAVADLFLGTPYLWGGNTRYGIDCSGLIQVALRSCGHDCPRDSDMQEEQLGETIDLDRVNRGDLLFWKGHVAFVAGADKILHANAHHMACAYEGMEAAISRIEAAGDGPVTSAKRLRMA